MAKQLQAPEKENARLTKMVAELLLAGSPRFPEGCNLLLGPLLH